MLCSPKELNIAGMLTGCSSWRLMRRSARRLASFFGDTVLDLEVTPNRADLLSHEGIAREIGTLTGKKVTWPGWAAVEPANEKPLRVPSKRTHPATTRRCSSKERKSVPVPIGCARNLKPSDFARSTMPWTSRNYRDDPGRPASPMFLTLPECREHSRATVKRRRAISRARWKRRTRSCQMTSSSLTMRKLWRFAADGWRGKGSRKPLATSFWKSRTSSLPASGGRHGGSDCRVIRATVLNGALRDSRRQSASDFTGRLIAESHPSSDALSEIFGNTNRVEGSISRKERLRFPFAHRALLRARHRSRRGSHRANPHWLRLREDGGGLAAAKVSDRISRRGGLDRGDRAVIGMDAIPARTQGRLPMPAQLNVPTTADGVTARVCGQGLHEARSITLVPAQPLGLAATHMSPGELPAGEEPDD